MGFRKFLHGFEWLFIVASVLAGAQVIFGVWTDSPNDDASVIAGIFSIMFGLILLGVMSAPKKEDGLTYQELADLTDTPVRLFKQNASSVDDKFVFPSNWTEIQKIDFLEKHPTYK